MAESQKKSSKEKNMALDLDIGNDFLSTWKSMSAADGDDMDFDVAPASKGKKKSFDFGNADMDFDLGGDFGKMSPFNVDMSDLDISPPLKKDGTSKEKPKESSGGNDKGKIPSFDMDMSDLDFSPPLKKDGTSKEKPKESSGGNGKGTVPAFNMGMSDLDFSPPLKIDGPSKEKSKEFSTGKDKGKADHFSFSFDFDDLDNFSFDPSSTKEATKAQKQNDSTDGSPNGSGNPGIEGSSFMNHDGNMRTIEDLPHKEALSGTIITANVDCQDGGNADLETTMKNDPLQLAIDDSIASKYSTAAHEVSSDKVETPSEMIIASAELPKNSRSEKDADDYLPSFSLFDKEPSGGNSLGSLEKVAGNSLGSLDKVDFINKGAGGSIQERDVNYSHTVAISEKNTGDKSDGEKSESEIENHVIDNKERTNSSIGVIPELSTVTENQEPASEILLSSASLVGDKLSAKETEGVAPVKLADKETENEKEPSVSCSRMSIQMEKAKCDKQKAPAIQTTDPSVCSQKKCFAQPVLDECRRDRNSIQSNIKLASLQQSKTLLRKENRPTQSQESSKISMTCGEVDDTSAKPSGIKLSDSFTKQNLDVLRGKSALGQRETSMKDLNTLSSFVTLSSLSKEINKQTAQKSKTPVTLASLPMKSTPIEENKLSACEGGRKTADLHCSKLSGLKLDSKKSPNQKAMKSVGDITQNRVSSKKSPTNIVNFADLQKLSPFTQSLKRKTSEESNADKSVLYPSKRCSLSPLGSRNFVDSSERVLEKNLEKKVSNQNKVEDDRNKTTLGDRLLSTIDVQSKENVKGLELPPFSENESHIKQAEAYSKELDDICNMLRNKCEVAKELLVRATVNSNKLLMLNPSIIQEKIAAVQNSIAMLKV